MRKKNFFQLKEKSMLIENQELNFDGNFDEKGQYHEEDACRY
jgi:hypothetical protein